jgi:hypothetical protein
MLFKEDRKNVYKNVAPYYFETKMVGAMVKDLTIQMEVIGDDDDPYFCVHGFFNFPPPQQFWEIKNLADFSKNFPAFW